MVGIICPPPVGIGLTDLPNIGGASGPPGPPRPPRFRHHCIQIHKYWKRKASLEKWRQSIQFKYKYIHNDKVRSNLQPTLESGINVALRLLNF